MDSTTQDLLAVVNSQAATIATLTKTVNDLLTPPPPPPATAAGMKPPTPPGK